MSIRVEPATASAIRIASDHLDRPIAALVREYLRDGIADECNGDESLRTRIATNDEPTPSQE